MKKRYILTFIIPAVLGAVIAWILTPSPTSAFLNKLKRYENADNYKIDIKITSPKFSTTYEQYKSDGKFYANYSPSQNGDLLINVDGKNVLFGNNKIVVPTTTEALKRKDSLYLLDKISVKNIDLASIKRDKSVQTDSYIAKLSDGTEVYVTFEKGNLKSIVYNSIDYSNQLIDVGVDNAIDSYGDVELEVTSFETNVPLERDFMLSSDAYKMAPEELESLLADDSADLDDLNSAFNDLAEALGVEFEDNEEDEELEDDVEAKERWRREEELRRREMEAAEYDRSRREYLSRPPREIIREPEFTEAHFD